MGLMSNIICKTAGVAGLSLATYDAHKKGKVFSKSGVAMATADTYESVIATTRTMGTASATTNAMQKKVADFRTSNPLVPFFAKIKGYLKGFLQSAGENIVPVTFSAMALGGGNKTRKFGVFGLAAYSLYMILKEGFGVGKTSPMD